MNEGFQLDRRLAFEPDESDALLRSIPAAPGVFALRGADSPNGAPSEPYLSRTADLRRRLRRLLAPPETSAADGQPVLSRRLNLRNRVRFLEYTRTGSDFESTLLLYRASCAAFGPAEARRRLRLHPPFFLRLTISREHPRVYITNRPSKHALEEFFGPFPSRVAAERYADAVLDLFQLRRCHEDLQPFPGHPGCVYGEMNKCLRPCKGSSKDSEPASPEACTPAQYAAEASRVHAFLRTRGQSLLDEIAARRDEASSALDFEAAAALHKHWEKVRAAALQADEIIRPLPALRAVILQAAAPCASAGPANRVPAEPGSELAEEESADESGESSEDSGGRAAVFLLAHGRLAGPERLSTLGVRAVREQTAVGSSLFAQPLMLAAVPLEEPVAAPSIRLATGPVAAPASNSGAPGPASGTWLSTEASAAPLSPEDRARAVLARLAESASADPVPTLDELCDTLSLFRRWYYRPEKQRSGEVFLPQASPEHPASADAAWPIRRILNGAARIVLGPPAAAPPVDREAYKSLAKPNELKTKVIHQGREGVERTVPVLPRRKRSRAIPLSSTE